MAASVKTSYTSRLMNSGKVAVMRHNRFYPNGVYVTKFPTFASADAHIARQVAEDKETRARHVMEYLLERAARPAPVKVDDGQGSLF